MYKDDYGNIHISDDLICPYCGEVFYDSEECIPNEDGELNWNQECYECGKTFYRDLLKEYK
ncbi:MAG: hypothetical protein PF569_02330 [Candidatus Woesearchaeota archaeon]|jgi:hypothetical protein|nr:hypothetical protein [Candidatus Woesearchaeota archaeon]